MSDERVNAKLTDEASEALRALVERTGLRKTDLVNRAICVYEFVDDELSRGGSFRLKEGDGMERELVFLFGGKR